MTFEERTPSQTNYMTTSSSFSEDYSLLDRIGDGGYASVFLAVSKKNRFQYAAVKRLSKDRAGRSADSMTERYLQEAQILSTINHPNILHYETCYNEKDYVYIVTEYLTGSDLYMQVTQEDRRLKEKTCRHIIRSLLKAVQYLHQQNIVHRDIKLENIISTIDMKEESESQRLNPACPEVIKLIDFGFAAVADGETLQDSVGTHYYAAPEIYKHEAYGKSVDMWSLGVVTYCLLYGQYPFYSKQKNLLAKQILSAQYRFRVRNRAGEFVSEEVKSFVSRLLVPNPNHRMTVEEALNHPWISQEKMSFGAVVKVIQAVKKFKKLLSKRRSDKSKEETVMEIDIPIKTYEDDRASSVTTIDLTDSAETMMSPTLPFTENHSLISETSPVDPSTFKITIHNEASTAGNVEDKSTSTHTISYSGDVVWEIGGVWGNFKQRMRDALYSGFSQIR